MVRIIARGVAPDGSFSGDNAKWNDIPNTR